MFKVIYFVYRYRAAEFIAADPLHDGIRQTSQFAVEPGLVATGPILLGLFFFPFAAVLNIEMEHEFRARILAYAAVDDCGTVLNPKIVEGQAFGGTAHGIGAALMESFDYDEDGNLLAATFSDYCPITSMNMPQIAHANIETLPRSHLTVPRAWVRVRVHLYTPFPVPLRTQCTVKASLSLTHTIPHLQFIVCSATGLTAIRW